MDQKLIRAEKVESRALAVIYDGSELGKELLDLLRHDGLRVIFVDAEANLLVLEKPSYIVFFALREQSSEQLRTDWREAVVTAKRNEARLVLCEDNLTPGITQRLLDEAKDNDQPVRQIEIIGRFGDAAERALAAAKIKREVFSSGGEKVVLVGKTVAASGPGQYTANVTDRKPKEREYATGPKSASRSRQWLTIVSLAVILFFFPLILAAGVAGWGVVGLRSAEELLVGGRFDEAKLTARDARERFALASGVISGWGEVAGRVGLGATARNYADLLGVGKSAANGLAHMAEVAKIASGTLAGIVQDTAKEGDLETSAAKIKPELAAIDQDLGLIAAQWESVTGLETKIAPWLGFSTETLAKIPDKISRARQLLGQANGFFDVLPEIVGEKGEARKKYLVVFQNSAELRPTGGFIGSYAIVSFDRGQLLNFKINDIFTADGQLRGRIAPPDEILHFLGQPSWYMRDANWAADWPLTAKRLAWFLEKETGEQVSGVWAVTLPLVPKLLAATGPLFLPDLKQTVSAGDFYYKAEYTAEINFFPGSTQKRDFLGAAAQALLGKLTSAGGRDWAELAQALGQALLEKDVMLYFDNERVQGVMETAGWGGTIVTKDCGQAGTNCLMIVEANLGANKSNFFLSRSVAVNALIGKAGEVENRVVVRYQNNSPSVSWPGGTYKNYLRFLVPVDAQLVGFDLGDGRKPRISEVLTADVLSQVPADQFLVFQNRELSGRSKGASDSALLSFGAYFEVPVGETRTVTFAYRPSFRVDLAAEEPSWSLTFLRQPGTGLDPLELVVDYPAFLQPLEGSWPSEVKVLVLPQKLDYNTDLSRDRKIQINFQNASN